MKKRSFFVLVLAISALVGCGRKTQKVLTTDYAKVQTAFNGVEKSFKKISTNSKKAVNPSGALPKYKNVDNGLNTIFSYYTNDDIRGHSVEDLSYDEPPMIQFQYLKAVFDKVGKGYEFGTKYYDNIIGDMYFDIETGLKDETKKAENKYRFDYELAIDISIDSNNLINADVAFDIIVTNDKDSYETKWFVNLLLDYDMENSSPTYSLTMYTENDEKDFPFFNRFTYEYDYVDVKDSKINEWRKFCMHSSKRLVKDNNHQSFTDYIDKDDIDYVVDYPKWFKDGNYYKLTQMSTSTQKGIGNAMYDGLGLNAGEINGDQFFAKKGTKNDIILICYQDFSKIYGDELIYDIVCRDEDNIKADDSKKIAQIRAMNEDGSSGAENLLVPNIKFGEIFTGFQEGIDNDVEYTCVYLWYAQEDGYPLQRINSLNGISLYFTMHDAHNYSLIYEPVSVSDNTGIDYGYKALADANNIQELSNYARIIFKDEDRKVEGYMDFIYVGILPSEYVRPEWPQEFKQYNVPAYETDNNATTFSQVEKDGEHYSIHIYHSNEQEATWYGSVTLPKAGFEKHPNFTNTENDVHFRKEYGNSNYVVVYYNYKSINDIYVEVYLESKPWQDPGNEDQNNNEQEPNLVVNSIVLVGDFNNWSPDPSNAGYVFQKTDDNSFLLYGIDLPAEYSFKMVVNTDWAIHNQSTSYGGYGWDDIDNIDEYVEYLSPASEGAITAKRHLRINLNAAVSGDQVLFVIDVKPYQQ